uniref:Uncharacterized protein n=1 Tax=Steinernema glaseri TaxID=37863 RepID=A0A1I7Z0L1_9BILA
MSQTSLRLADSRQSTTRKRRVCLVASHLDASRGTYVRTEARQAPFDSRRVFHVYFTNGCCPSASRHDCLARRWHRLLLSHYSAVYRTRAGQSPSSSSSLSFAVSLSVRFLLHVAMPTVRNLSSPCQPPSPTAPAVSVCTTRRAPFSKLRLFPT